MEKIYPWNCPMCFQVLLYCFQLVTEYIWHRNIWFLLSLLCFKMRWNPFWNLILFFPNMSTKLKNSFLKTKERRNEKVVIFKKWYFVTKIDLTRKKCSSGWEKLLKFKAEGYEWAKFLRSLEQFIQTMKGKNNFWQQNIF